MAEREPADLPALGFESRRMMQAIGSKLFGAEPKTPVSLGRYRILDKLGEGGMGIVYKAYEPDLDRIIALKILSVHGTQIASRFLREARIMAKLSHPHVVTIHEVGRDEGDQAFLAMELMPGGTLGQWARDNRPGAPRRFDRILEFTVAAAQALAAAHDADIVHRDVKPDNMLLDGRGCLKLADFGLARSGTRPDVERRSDVAVRTKDARLSSTGQAIGTPLFMAPEQFDGESSAKSDQFALCVSIFYVVFGELPFPPSGKGDGLGLPPGARLSPPTATQARMPPWFRAVLERGLAHDPADRFADMHAFLAAIDRGRRRPRRIVAASLGALAVVGLASFAILPKAEGPCAELDHTQDWWGVPQSVLLREAFTATELSYAQGSAEAVVTQLDAYAAGWGAARRGVCESHAAGAQSGALLDEKMACFERRKRRARALIDSLGHADAETVRRSTRAVSALPTVASCVDTTRVLALRGDPPPPNVASEVDAIDELVDRSVAARDLGRKQVALDLAREAGDRAEATHYPLVAARAHVELAEVHYVLGDRSACRDHAQSALVAARKAGNVELAARAAQALVWADGDVGTHERGSFWAEVALADADAVARPGFVREVKALHAELLAEAGEVERALEIHEELLEHAPEWGALALATSSTNAASAYLQAGRDERGLELAGRAVASFEEALGPDHPDTLTARLNLGVAHWNLGALDLAEEHMSAVWEGRVRNDGAMARTTASAGINLGMIRSQRGRLDEGIADLLAARPALVELGDPLEVAQLDLELAALHARAGDHDMAVEVGEAAAAAIAEHSDAPAMIVGAFTGLVTIYSEAGRQSDARHALERGLEVAAQLDPQHYQRLALEALKPELGSN